MRKKINSFLIIVSVIMLVVACQPKAWWEDYWWPEKFPEREDPLPTDTVVSAISIPGLLSDVFASGEKGIDVEWLRTDPFSQLMARSSIDGAVADCIYAVITYDDYSNPAISNEDLVITEGKIVFEFKLESVNFSYPVEVLSFNAYVLDDIIINHHDSKTDYIISSISGITGAVTDVEFKISETNGVLNAVLTSDSSLDGFDTDVEIKVEINENEIDTSDAMTNEEAAYLVDSDNWFWLFARGEGEGFRGWE